MSEKAKPLTAEAGERLTLVGEKALQRLVQERDAARERIAELEAKCAALQQQAQIQAQEMRTQRATVREAYQVCTGAKGEPGDWNGAEPIRALAARAEAAEARERKLVEALRWARTMYRPEADSDMVRAIDAALSPYTPAAPEMPADCHPQEG